MKNYIQDIDTLSIPKDRVLILEKLVDAIQIQINKDSNNIPIQFICTHNSRRSHLGQIWAQTMADFYGFPEINCFSGGTETTALYPSVLLALKEKGFTYSTLSDSDNPIYAIQSVVNYNPIIGFSKTFDDQFNPSTNFIAVMTCSSADEGCPFIAGATHRIALTYEDPKAFDGTKEELERYIERSTQISTEMKFVFSKLKKK